MLTEKRETTGPAAAIKLTADRTEINADGEDVAVIKVEGLDKEGRLVPTGGQSHRVQGDGRRHADWCGEWRSELPGERQGSEALAVQWAGAGDCAGDEGSGRDQDRGFEGRLGWAGIDAGFAHDQDEEGGVKAGGVCLRTRDVGTRSVPWSGRFLAPTLNA